MRNTLTFHKILELNDQSYHYSYEHNAAGVIIEVDDADGNQLEHGDTLHSLLKLGHQSMQSYFEIAITFTQD